MKRKIHAMSIYEVHYELFNVLSEVTKVFARHNIRYYLIFGTLLGCVRDEGPIKWDDDIDICVGAKDWDRMNEILLSEIDRKKMFILNKTTRPEYPDWRFITRVGVNGTYRRMDYYKNESDRSGIFIDIFQLCAVPDGKIKSKLWEYGLDLVDGVINLKTMRTGYYSRPPILSQIAYKLFRAKKTSYWNTLRCQLQNVSNGTNTKYVTVPFGHAGVYSLQKAKYYRTWFDTSCRMNFQVKNRCGEIVRSDFFSVPSGYREILDTTYGDWSKKPKMRVAPATSFWGDWCNEHGSI